MVIFAGVLASQCMLAPDVSLGVRHDPAKQVLIVYEMEDIGFCNRVGRMVANCNPGPCCLPGILEPQDAFPSSHDHLELLQAVRVTSTPSHFTELQINALNRMRNIKDNAPIGKAGFIHSRYLNEFSACVVRVFFPLALMSRVDIFWSQYGAFIGKGEGVTSQKSLCKKHRQTPHVVITLDPFQRCTESPRKWRERIFSGLMHELCHAYLDIYVARPSLVREYFLILGIGGHGTAFGSLLDWVAWVLRTENVLKINMHQYLYISILQDKANEKVIFDLADLIDHGSLTQKEVRQRIAKTLRIRKRQANTWSESLHFNHGALESVARVGGLFW